MAVAHARVLNVISLAANPGGDREALTCARVHSLDRVAVAATALRIAPGYEEGAKKEG